MKRRSAEGDDSFSKPSFILTGFVWFEALERRCGCCAWGAD
jgi:hypothetical protein